MFKKEWVRLPSWWIHKDKQLLCHFTTQEIADSIAALELYIAIALRANNNKNTQNSSIKTGYAKLSYNELQDMTFISRALISSGLKKLSSVGLIKIHKDNKTNIYQLEGFNLQERWAKLPYAHIYSGNNEPIKPFKGFSRRNKHELNSLKLYLLFIERRNQVTNHAKISYDKIIKYTRINRNDIRSGLSLLINLDLIHLDRYIRDEEGEQVYNAYRICGIDSRKNKLKNDLTFYPVKE